MNEIVQTSLEKLDDSFSDNNYILLAGLGFDNRSLAVINHFPIKKIDRIIGVSNVGWKHFNQENIDKFKSLDIANKEIIGCDSKSIIDVGDELVKFIESVLELPSKHLVVDITSFSHELLAVLIGVFNSFQIMNRTTMLYVGASEYSFNTDVKDIWLSRGVRQIRSVLGFPGTMLPSKKLHLIILAGFEVERAMEVITCYEPASISIGLGKKEQSVSGKHHDTNKVFFERLNQFVKNQDENTQDIYHFEFSCVNPMIAKNQLLDHIGELNVLKNKNIVVCPLNTKIVTVGVALAAIEHPEIQICYAEPEEYNTDGYSKAGENVTIFSLENINNRNYHDI